MLKVNRQFKEYVIIIDNAVKIHKAKLISFLQFCFPKQQDLD